MTEAPEGGSGPQDRHLPRGLVRTGAVITIVASVAGLLTTGVATLYSARIANDQLKQSKEVAEEKRREQAARVSYGVDVQPDGTPRLHLTNRSPDPISDAAMVFEADYFADSADAAKFETSTAMFVVRVVSVPPCSDLVFTSKDMRYRKFGDGEHLVTPYPPLADEPPGSFWESFDHPPRVRTESVVYTDRNGQMWQRDNRGLLTEGPLPHAPRGKGADGAVMAVQPQPLKACADAAGLPRSTG